MSATAMNWWVESRTSHQEQTSSGTCSIQRHDPAVKAKVLQLRASAKEPRADVLARCGAIISDTASTGAAAFKSL